MSSFSGYAQASTSGLLLVTSFTLLLLMLSFAPAYAQGGIESIGTGGKHTIQGRIFFPSGRRADAPIKVKLESTNAGMVSVIADPNGTFTFRNLEPGSYTVVIESDEYETVREPVLIEELKSRVIPNLDNNPRNFVIPIYLQPKRSNNSSTAKSGVLNAALANVPSQAADLYERALQSIKAGDQKKGVEQLKSAVDLYPNFALALNELGVQYLKLGQVDKAIEALRAALKADPEAISPRLNYGIALLGKKNFTEAEAQFRQVLKKNDSLTTAHLYLGLALIHLARYDDAEKELLRAATLGRDSMALAHYYLGGIYWQKKEYGRAAAELETYLKLEPNAPEAARVRTTIKEMREKATDKTGTN
jgi:tetratricopeptide (TPR) repeat protein